MQLTLSCLNTMGDIKVRNLLFLCCFQLFCTFILHTKYSVLQKTSKPQACGVLTAHH